MKTITFNFITLIIFGINALTAQNVFSDKNNVANNGYDMVSYFTTNSAQRGSKDFSTSDSGVAYYFISAENLAAFEKSPESYVPQFDGYCSFAVAKMNQKVPVDPETFRIDDGKLYLFYNDYWEGKPFNTIVPWLNNETELEKAAATNWKILKDKK